MVAPGEDPNGMERLTGESDEEYIARQTRLRAEAKSRMAAKFGGGGGRMGGVGSDSSYNPNAGYGGGMGSNIDVDSIVSGVASAFSTLGAFGRSSIQTASAALQDQKSMQQFTGTIRNTGSGMRNSMTSAVNEVTSYSNNDGFSNLQSNARKVSSNKTSNNIYEGFGSGNNWQSGPSSTSSNGFSSNTGAQFNQTNFAVKKNNNSVGRTANPAAAKSGKTLTSSNLQNKMKSDDFFASFGA